MKSYSLKNGTLELTSLHDGKLILGSYKGDRTYPYDIVRILKQAQVTHGHIEKNIALIQSGIAGELPIAQARIEDEPGEVEFLFEPVMNSQVLSQLAQSGGQETFDLKQKVSKNQKLVKVHAPPRRVLRYPDGRIDVLKVLEDSDLTFYLGKNTMAAGDQNSIISLIDGYVTKDLYGSISVSPLSRIRNVGKAHGHVYYDSALEVEADIRTESDIETTSTLVVQGTIRSSKLETSGNIIGGFGFSNPTKLEIAQVKTGGSLITTSIRDYTIYCSNYLFAKAGIENSQVHCLNTIVTPRIKNSEIRIARKLLVRSIEKGVQVYLGPDSVADFRLKENSNFQKQHEKRLVDLEKEMDHIRDRMCRDQKIALAQLNKLKRISPDMISNDLILNRHYSNHLKELSELNNRLSLYEDQSKVVAQDKIKQTFYDRQFDNSGNVEMIVLGPLAEGTIIHSRNHTLKIDSTRNGVTVKVDNESGEISVE